MTTITNKINPLGFGGTNEYCTHRNYWNGGIPFYKKAFGR